MLDRRRFLLSAAGSLFAGSLATGCSSPLSTRPQQGTAGAADPVEALNRLFDEFMAEILDKRPILVTSLGLDRGERAWAKSLLDDVSLERRREAERENADRLRRLRAFDRSSLSGLALANYDTVAFQMETSARAARFPYGDGPSPYVVHQMDGAYEGIPTFLDRQHTIENREDAESYVARLRAFAHMLDQETERIRHDAGLGVIPPDFIIQRTVQQIRALRAIPVTESILTTSLARRAAQKGLPDSYAGDAQRIVTEEIYPALERQEAALESLLPRAVHHAGIDRLPDGPAFYEVALRFFTTTDMDADEIHRLGLEQVREISARMEEILRGQGLTQGSLAERVQALGRDPRHLFPNTDEGRQQILDYCNGLIAGLEKHLPQYFGVLPKTPVEVRRIPPYTEAGAPGGYYQRPALDGSRPGAFFINLRDTSELPRWTLPTLTYHEAAPGHHFQLALVLEMPDLPLIRKIGGFSANTEGWALYAEQLADEMGLYADDPLGRLGWLQATIFRAARCVVDTGLHSKGWSREQAIQYMVETTGDHPAAMTTEVERYCAMPGQATSYKVGHTVWVRLREEARAALGPKFDIRAFHDTGLTAGPMPLAVLERVVKDWVSSHA
ncbi:MAG: DUF885 family protein [Pseudomonadota bacterium]|jgi:Uncharacterized protein conserved in bacteria|nr:MAG: DUF885 domain-containing protein [Pseudomonadota bacterium]